MNPGAIQLYLDNGIDLHSEMLEIAVCAQHCNGGVAVDGHWRSGVDGLYAAGEAAGTFGPKRPGGSALNAAQVGSMRAARHIARQPCNAPEIPAGAVDEAERLLVQIAAAMGRQGSDPADIKLRCRQEFSAHCAHVRSEDKFAELYDARISDIASYYDNCVIAEAAQIPAWFLARDMLITQAAILSAMQERSGEGVVRTRFDGRGFASERLPARPIPERDTWFETVWEKYRLEATP